MEDSLHSVVVEPPRGLYTSRVDDKGRLKMPADFQRYLVRLNAERVFVTSFDAKVARIYPGPVWKEVENLLRDPGEDAEAAEDLWFTANDFGGDSEMDAQGRLVLPPELRRTLGIENQPVYLEQYKGHINVFGQGVYDERKRRAAENREEKLKTFERRGLL